MLAVLQLVRIDRPKNSPVFHPHEFFLVSAQRKAMRDISLTDGSFIPKGAIICFPAHAIHRDNEVYENPGTFNPLRFVNREGQDQCDNTRNQMVTVSAEFLGFGLGRSAWYVTYMQLMVRVLIRFVCLVVLGDSSPQLC